LMLYRTPLLVASGALMCLFALRSLGVLKISLFDREARPGLARVRSVGGVASAFLFGAAFALGWSPCIGPILTSVLPYVAPHADRPAIGAAYLAVYATGLALPLVIAAAFLPSLTARLRTMRSLIPYVEKGAGALMLLLGVLTIVSARTAVGARVEKPSAT